ncbi:unnamed protein product [Mytilus edulis]|uniref:C2H2-type domain-containing protein n=1 Tax=Mytilus edulis TaxID=6550 RepID=A0A8S3V9K0_MYTED|nr:unnamed protein product [Mytilus edulis]
MEGCPILTDIINCFTSTDQLLTFVRAYGLEDDPYVQLRLTHLRQTNSMDFKCTTCGEWFSNQENYEFHMLYHETIQDFDLSLFDDTPPDKNHIEPTINSNKRTTSIPDSCDVYTPPPAKKQVSHPTSMVPVTTTLQHISQEKRTHLRQQWGYRHYV